MIDANDANVMKWILLRKADKWVALLRRKEKREAKIDYPNRFCNKSINNKITESHDFINS